MIWKRLANKTTQHVKNNFRTINLRSRNLENFGRNNILSKIEDFQEGFLNLEYLYKILIAEILDQHNYLKLLQKEIYINIETLINKINKIKSGFFQEFSDKLY